MVKILTGDCRDLLKIIPDQSVHCCITSPPYWGLRDYGHPDQIGLESTPDEYVASLVAVFREVRRVLMDDGTCWVNLGDSYNGLCGTGGATEKQSTNIGSFHGGNAKRVNGLKPKDLVGIPWRVAFALQADGWYLRQDIIWAKPNPMPESVTDRCTKAHEYVFLLAKSERYWYDAEAIKEMEVMKPQNRLTPRKENPTAKVHGMPIYRQAEGGTGGGTRNRRSVWTVATQPYSGAHFAVMPPALVEPCILAGCPAQTCPTCGKGWERVVERKASTSKRHTRLDCPQSHHPGQVPHRVGGFDDAQSRTIGFRTACDCQPANPIPGVVLDPFGGSGTTGHVAERLGRNSILIELNSDYVKLINNRTSQIGMML